MTHDLKIPGSILIIGASRGLGLAMAEDFAARGWRVTATKRGATRTPLDVLAEARGAAVEVEHLDITQPDEIAALCQRLTGRTFDILFVNAGVANMADEPVAEISTDEFVRVVGTNALGPMRVVEALHDLVEAAGLIGVMSSGQGSITNNTNGRHEIYRCSKAALNQLTRSYAARRLGELRALVLLAPGWVRTDLGGPKAPLGVEEVVPQIATTLIAQLGEPGLRFIDRFGDAVPW